MAFWKNTKTNEDASSDQTPNPTAVDQSEQEEKRYSFEELFGKSSTNQSSDNKQNTESDFVLPRKKEKRIRDCSVHFFLTPEENARLNLEAKAYGISKSEYIRRVLFPQAALFQADDSDEQLLIQYKAAANRLRAELGRQAGMLKLGMHINLQKKVERSEQWEVVESLIRYLERYAKMLASQLEKMSGVQIDSGRLSCMMASLNGTLQTATELGLALKNIVNPARGERVYDEKEWAQLVLMCSGMADIYSRDLKEIREDLNGYYKASKL